MKPIRLWAVATVAFFALIFIVGLHFIRRQLAHEPGTEMIEGVRDLADSAITLIRIPFATAHLELHTGHTQRLAWSCDTGAGAHALRVVVEAGIATLNLEDLPMAKCLISLPVRTGVEIRGVNGHMQIERPSTDLDIMLNSGNVQIAADPKRAYDFDVQVKNGLQDFFPRSRNPDAVRVKVNLNTGSVKKR